MNMYDNGPSWLNDPWLHAVGSAVIVTLLGVGWAAIRLGQSDPLMAKIMQAAGIALDPLVIFAVIASWAIVGARWLYERYTGRRG